MSNDTETVTGEVVEQYDSGHSLPRGVRVGNPELDYDATYKLVRVDE